jgi:hypothetical protein
MTMKPSHTAIASFHTAHNQALDLGHRFSRDPNRNATMQQSKRGRPPTYGAECADCRRSVIITPGGGSVGSANASHCR